MMRSLATVLCSAFLVAGMMAVDDATARGGGSGARGGGGSSAHGSGGHGHRGGVHVGRGVGHPVARFHGVRPWVSGVVVGGLVAAPLAYYGYSGYYGPGPYYYPPSYYYDNPPAYVEPGYVPLEQAPASWWYYCQGSNTYYPYIKECPGGWQRVAPQPPR